MNTDNAIEVRDISKSFTIRRTNKGKKTTKIKRTVIDKMTFDVKKGEVLGIIGYNGSGKSTTLSMLAGILCPDSGSIYREGSVSSILELGMGFHPEFTGRENIATKCAIYGFSKKEIDEIIDNIIAFSELGAQIDDPVRTYSSGMYSRLAFSVAINVKCNIVIVDEILSVGDYGFNERCAKKFEEMKNEGKTIIIASHSMVQIQKMSDRVLWIDNGAIKESGNPFTVCAHYTRSIEESFDTVIKMANEGDIESQYKIGRMYQQGEGVNKNETLAIEWYKKAALSGHTVAIIAMAELAENNENTEEAMHYYKMAADAGNKDAQLRLFVLSNRVRSVELSNIKAIAELNNVRAIRTYADALFSGIYGEKNKSLANHWYEKAARIGDIDAAVILGINYRNGDGVLKDGRASEMWLKYASDHYSVWGMWELINTYKNGLLVPIDMEKTIVLLTALSKMGDYNASHQIGDIYHNGIGISKDDVVAKMWYDKGNMQKVAEAECKFAETIIVANINDEQNQIAIKMLNDAGNKCYPEAYRKLGELYHNGYTIDRDLTKAVECYQYAASCDNIEATFKLSMILLHDFNSPSEALPLLQKAVQASNPCAYNEMGMWLMREDATNNKEKARQMFSFAADYGIIGAKENLSSLQS